MKLCYEELRENCSTENLGGFSSKFELDERALQPIWVRSCQPLSNVSDVKDDVGMKERKSSERDKGSGKVSSFARVSVTSRLELRPAHRSTGSLR